MIDKKARATRVLTPRNTSKSRSNSPDATNKRRKLRSTGNKATTKKLPKAKTNLTIENLNARNHDLCDACNGPGQFLCCEGCPNAFHFGCVEPPMDYDEVNKLEGEWFCNRCVYERKRNTNTSTSSSTIQRPLSFFSSITEEIERQNPVAFTLPEEIRTYFDGVSTGKNGAYIDATTVKPVKYRNGRAEEQDYHRLKDKNDNYIFCYWCYRTALKKPMISCDFCSLHWHLDCLDPPLTIPPNINKKWKCPCHTHRHDRYRTPRKQVEAAGTASSSYSFDIPYFATDERTPDQNDPSATDRDDELQTQFPDTPDTSDEDGTKAYFLRPQIIRTNFIESSYRLLTKEERKLKRNGSGN